MITLKSGYTYTYAVTEKVNSDVSEEYKSDDQRKSQQKNTTEQSYVMVEDGGSPLVTALNEPEIKGVVVVCAGGGAPKVVAQVTAAVKPRWIFPLPRLPFPRSAPAPPVTDRLNHRAYKRSA